MTIIIPYENIRNKRFGNLLHKVIFFPQYLPVDVYLEAVTFPKIVKKQQAIFQSKKTSNDQELIQSEPTSCPQNQKGNN